MEAKPVEENDDEINEIVGTATVAMLATKLITLLHRTLGAYNELTKISDELLRDPNAPDSLKSIASGASQAGSDIASGAGPIAKDLPVGQKLGKKAIEMLIQKHTGLSIDLDDLGISIPGLTASDDKPQQQQSSPEPEPAPEPEPEQDTTATDALGVLPKDKAERLAQLRAKYRGK